MTDQPELYVVRPNRALLWPVDDRLYPVPKESGSQRRGHLRMLSRQPQLRVRGRAGYVVDLNAPFEREWCAGQGAALMAVTELPEAERPKQASPIELETAIALRGGSPTRSESPPASTEPPVSPSPTGKHESAPDVRGSTYHHYDAPERVGWAGVYVSDSTGKATHLLPIDENPAPVPVDRVPRVERPSPLIPA